MILTVIVITKEPTGWTVVNRSYVLLIPMVLGFPPLRLKLCRLATPMITCSFSQKFTSKGI